jgi:small subunit ribosomal protein S17
MPRTLTGTVSSAAPDKTIVISVVTHRTHPIYKKQFVTSKKFIAHDENNECKVGDLVSIIETRPISARKRFKLEKVLEKAELTREELSVLEPEETPKQEKTEAAAKAEKPVEKKAENKPTKKQKKAVKIENKDEKQSEEDK